MPAVERLAPLRPIGDDEDKSLLLGAVALAAVAIASSPSHAAGDRALESAIAVEVALLCEKGNPKYESDVSFSLATLEANIDPSQQVSDAAFERGIRTFQRMVDRDGLGTFCTTWKPTTDRLIAEVRKRLADPASMDRAFEEK